MAAKRVGETLRERREQLGISIAKAANGTNIRPRVLQAFENSDYAKYPPLGYAKGMLSSYARYLRIDPRPILEDIETEMAEHEQRLEVEEMTNAVKDGSMVIPKQPRRSSMPSISEITSSMTAVAPGESGVIGAIDSAGDIARATSAIKVVNRSGHRSAQDRKRSSSAGSSSSRSASAKPAGESSVERYKASRRRRYGTSSSTNSNEALASSENAESVSSTLKARKSAVSMTGRLSSIKDLPTTTVSDERPDDDLMADDYTRRRGGKRRPTSRGAGKSSRRHYEVGPDENIFQHALSTVRAALEDKHSRMIIIAVALVIVALLVLGSVLVSSAGSNSDGILDVQGGATGETTTKTKTGDNGTATATVTTANGNPVVVTVEVADGKTSLLRITYDDDRAFDGTAVGPWSREFQVTESMTATFGTPDAVTVTENGEKIDIPISEDGSGTLNINVKASGLAASSLSGEDDSSNKDKE